MIWLTFKPRFPAFLKRTLDFRVLIKRRESFWVADFNCLCISLGFKCIHCCIQVLLDSYIFVYWNLILLFFGIASPSFERGNVAMLRALKQGMFKLGDGCLVYQWVTYLELGFIPLNLVLRIIWQSYCYLVSVGYIQSRLGCVNYNW